MTIIKKGDGWPEIIGSCLGLALCVLGLLTVFGIFLFVGVKAVLWAMK